MSQPAFGNTLRRVLRRIETRPAGAHGDGALLARFAAQRDEAAFATLVQRHGPLVLGVCRRVLRDPHDAEDAFQAVFLVLARKARSLGRQPLGSWLYTVARNLALKHRAAAARRRTLEQKGGAMTPTEPRDELIWREMSEVLDAELGRLAENHRAPLVLCHLQGLTHEAAAQELGWPTGSLAKRLARGQELLRERLASRGVSLPTAAVLALVAERGTAAVPPALAAGTTRAAAQFAAGQSVASATAVSLAAGALQAMTTAKLKIAATLLLGFGLLGAGAGMGLIANQTKESVQAPAQANENEEPAPVAEEDPADQVRDVLSRPINLDKGIDPNTPLLDALEFLSDRYGLDIRLNETAFADVGVPKAGEMPVTLPKMVDVRLDTVLRMLTVQVAANHGLVGGIRIQGNAIVVGPHDPSEPAFDRQSRRIHKRLLRPVAWDRDIAEDTPLPAALDLLAARYGEKFSIDEKAIKLLGVASSRDLHFVPLRLAGGEASLAEVLELWCLAIQTKHYALCYRVHSEQIEISVARPNSAEVKSPASLRGLLREQMELQRKRAALTRRWEEQVCAEIRLDANTPLKDALEYLSDRYDLTMIIDGKGFEMVGLTKVEEHSVELPLQKNVKLEDVLRQILKQVHKGDWMATSITLDDYVEIAPLHKHVQLKKPLTREQLDRLWDDLAHNQWSYPVLAADVLAHFPGQVVPLLAERVHPAPQPDPAKLADTRAWVKKLDSNDYQVRQQATEELEKLGPLALPALHEQLAAKPTLEVRQRVDNLLRKLAPKTNSEQLRILRAIRVLEEIGTPEAERVLHGLAQGGAGAPQTEEAKAAIFRSFQ